MKPRKVIITLEVTTDIPLKELKDPEFWDFWTDKTWNFEQVQVNVAELSKQDPRPPAEEE